MQSIHISRYKNPSDVHYQGTVEPEDRSWILFIEEDGTPSLYIGVEASENEDGSGDTVHGYIPAEVYNWPPGVPMPEHIARMFGCEPASA